MNLNMILYYNIKRNNKAKTVRICILPTEFMLWERGALDLEIGYSNWEQQKFHLTNSEYSIQLLVENNTQKCLTLTSKKDKNSIKASLAYRIFHSVSFTTMVGVSTPH